MAEKMEMKELPALKREPRFMPITDHYPEDDHVYATRPVYPEEEDVYMPSPPYTPVSRSMFSERQQIFYYDDEEEKC